MALDKELGEKLDLVDLRGFVNELKSIKKDRRIITRKLHNANLEAKRQDVNSLEIYGVKVDNDISALMGYIVLLNSLHRGAPSYENAIEIDENSYHLYEGRKLLLRNPKFPEFGFNKGVLPSPLTNIKNNDDCVIMSYDKSLDHQDLSSHWEDLGYIAQPKKKSLEILLPEDVCSINGLETISGFKEYMNIGIKPLVTYGRNTAQINGKLEDIRTYVNYMKPIESS